MAANYNNDKMYERNTHYICSSANKHNKVYYTNCFAHKTTTTLTSAVAVEHRRRRCTQPYLVADTHQLLPLWASVQCGICVYLSHCTAYVMRT